LSSRHTTLSANYESSVVYAPPTRLPPSIKDPDTGAVVTEGPVSSGNDFLAEQKLGAQLDNAFRAAYFASSVTYAYVAYHETEAYRQFPYMRLNSFNYRQPKQCGVAPGRSINAYTPLCREWYKNAVDAWRATGRMATTVFNPVASDLVAPGQLFLSLSRALSTASGDLIGVVAVDVALADLSRQIEATKLYQRGYGFVWDANGKGVVHKNYRKETNLGVGPVDVALLDAGSDANFRTAFQQNIVDRGRVTGNWSNYWHNPDTGNDELWFYSFCPVQGTPYMLALTVVDQEVTARADDEISKLQSWVTVQVVISIFLCLGVLLLLLGFTWLFIKRFATPVMRLQKLVAAWGDGDYSNNVDEDFVGSASSLELRTITGNLSKLLVALRFGNPKYSSRTVGPEKEKQNSLNALAIVGDALRSPNPPPAAAKGIGVVFNNLALWSVAQAPEARGKGLEPGALFGEAIGNAKALQAEAKQQPGREADATALLDTLALRFLNNALWLLNEGGRSSEAAKCVREAADLGPTVSALGTITSNLSYKPQCCGAGAVDGHPANTNSTVSNAPSNAPTDNSRNGRAAGKDPALARAVQDAALKGLAEAYQKPVPFEGAADYADLCLALCDMDCPTLDQLSSPQLAAWTLEHVPSVTSQTLMRLALHAKALPSAGYQKALDQRMTPAGSGWDPQNKLTGVEAWQKMTTGPPPKVVLFVLDLSYSMDCDGRLPACKEALLAVLREHCGECDRVGLITFADDVRYEFPLAPKNYDFMERKVSGMRTRGRTAFYSAVLQALTNLAELGRQEPSTPKWVIALTDGADNMSSHSALSECLPLLKGNQQLNLALITVGDSLESSSGYDALIDAAKSGAHQNQGILINAANSGQISEAFGKVAAAMNSGVAEHL